MHLDGQVTKAVSGVSQNHDVPSAQRTINPIAELIRKGALEAGIRQGSNRAVTKVQRMINSLQWRQAHSKDEFYPLALESGKVLHIKQLQCGEITGLGTGATVWPAAHVLAKYIERRCGEGGLRGSRVVDLGSGTGVGGIVAAALGAEETFLTDQQQLLFLMRENAERCCGTSAVGGSRGNTDTVADERLETALTTKIGRPNNGGVYNNGDSRFGNSGGENKGSNDATRATDNPNQHQDKESAPSVHVLTYDWGMKDDQLSRPVDIILVSDCVLPKLYPIEPLVDAIDKLSGPNTTTFLSYEHRHYQAFDPRRRFEELVTARGFTKLNIPHAQQHPIFSADDIEIWEVRRSLRPLSQAARTEASIAVSDGGEQKAAGDNTATPAEGVTPSAVGRASVVVSHSTLGGEDVHVCSENAGTMVTLLEERHELAQSLSGSIGSYLWPSAIVMARHLVASCCISPSAKGSTPASGHTSSVGDASGESAFSSSSNGFSSSYPARVVALELGSGVGLVAMTAALLGWDVVGTDKADALPLLRANVTKCLSSTKRANVGSVEIVEYKWGSDLQGVLTRGRHKRNKSADRGGCSNGTDGSTPTGGYDVVMCADCVYAKSSVELLLATLCQVCDETTTVLVTNELRSAFDEFLRAAGTYFSVENLNVFESDMVIDADSNQGPTPIALKRLRRRRLA